MGKVGNSILISSSKMKFSAILLVISALISTTWAIKCHVCKSTDDKKCDDPFNYPVTKEFEEPKPRTMNFLVTCPKGKNVCRKIFQSIQGTETIIRQCGQSDEDEFQESYS